MSGTWKKWTAEEDAIIRDADERGIKTVALFNAGVLPGRSKINIQNRLATKRQQARGVCPVCREHKDSAGKRCADCRQAECEKQRRWVSEGLCASCGKPRGSLASATKCEACITRIRKINRAKLQKQPKKNYAKTPRAVQGPFYWPGTRSCKMISRHIPQGVGVVDLFSGAGRSLLWAKHAGHHIRAYNDIHPLLARLVQIMTVRGSDWHLLREQMTYLRSIQGLPFGVFQRWYRDALKGDFDPILGAALFYSMASCKFEPPFRVPDKIPHANNYRQAFGQVDILCEDYKAVIEQYDHPDTLFLADPPWPGAMQYEFSMDGRHRGLVEALVGCKGQFILAMSSSQASLLVLRGVPYMYWHYIGLGKEIVASSFPMESPQLEPFDINNYGV